MRPNPYKQARSRQYLAKQRAKYGKKAATDDGEKEPAGTVGGRRIPRWLRNLPSNIDRYQDDAEDPNATKTVSPEMSTLFEDYDFSKPEDMDELIKAFTLDQTGATPLPVVDHGTADCHLYERLASIDRAKLEQATTATSGDEFGEELGLPSWFIRREREHSTAPKVGTSRRPTQKSKKLPSLPTMASQQQSTLNREESDKSIPKVEGPKSDKKLEGEELLDSILDS